MYIITNERPKIAGVLHLKNGKIRLGEKPMTFVSFTTSSPSAEDLSVYEKKLRSSFILPQLEKFRKADKLLGDESLFRDLTLFSTEASYRYFNIDENHRTLLEALREASKKTHVKDNDKYDKNGKKPMSLKYFTIEERLNANAWDVDVHRPHIRIKDPEKCRKCEKSRVLICVQQNATYNRGIT